MHVDGFPAHRSPGLQSRRLGLRHTLTSSTRLKHNSIEKGGTGPSASPVKKYVEKTPAGDCTVRHDKSE